MRIAYLGPKNTFTELVAKELFQKDTLIPIQPIFKVIQSIENKTSDFAVVPLENFYDGEVRETLDSLRESKNTWIIKDHAIKIVHCLGVLQNTDKIKSIISKDTALDQCGKFIFEKYPDVSTISVSSTTEAIEKIIKENLIGTAAIASENALRSKGFKIITKDLCKDNKTRFVVLGRTKTKPTGNDKTFLVFHPVVKDRPGTLHQYIGFFSNLGINLEYIQSRPDGKGGYYFYIELLGHEEDKPVQIALKGLRYSLDPNNTYPNVLKVLGSYKNTSWKN